MYKSLSVSENMFPLSAVYPYDDKLSFKSSYREYDNGYNVISTPIFTNSKDFAFGNNTAFYVSSSMNLFDFMMETTKTLGIFDFVIYASLLAGNGNHVSDVSATLFASASTNPITQTEFFKIETGTDGTISIVNYDNKYATVDRYAPWNVTFQRKFIKDTYNQQKYNFYCREDKIYISTLFTNPYPQFGPAVIERFLSYSPVTNNIRSIGVITDDDYIEENKYVYTIDNLFISAMNTGFDTDVKWVSYYNDLGDHSHNKNVDIKNKVVSLKQNYLVNFPYKGNITLSNLGNTTVAMMPVNITNLKNIQTPEYEYATVPEVNRREYKSIFLGSNEDYGYDKPYLAFEADTKEVTFKTGNITYFHYPSCAPQMALSSVGFTQSGAIAGVSPVRSDKIWKKMANYSKNIWWGNSLQWQRGTFLCSWLSGNGNGDAVWKDRWYNPGYLTFQQAGSTINVIMNPYDPVIYDENSVMTFDPGVWYSYHHFGSNDNAMIIGSLSGTGTSLRLNIEDWAENTIDRSQYGNDGVVTSTDAVKGDHLLLDGVSADCIVPYSISLVTPEFTTSVWVKTNDWKNSNSAHIISNRFRGGWSIGHSNGFYNPTYTIFEQTYGHLLMTNVKNKTYTDFILPPSVIIPETAPYATPVALAVDKNLYTWVLDNEFKKLFKIDSTGDILKEYPFLSATNLQDLVIDANNSVLVLDLSSTIYKFNQNVDLVDTIVLGTSGYTTIDVDIDNNIWYNNYDVSIFDNNNTQWYVTSGSIYKDGSLIISNNAVDITIDRNNNVWILNNNIEFTKLDTNGTFILSGAISMATDTQGDRSIGIMDVNNEDVIIMIQSIDSALYRYDANGNYIDQKLIANHIDVSKYIQHDKTQMVFTTKGDFTGYDWNRKFRYVKNNKQSVIDACIDLGNDYSDLSCVYMSYPTSGFIDGDWILLTMTHSNSGISNLYIDGILRDTVSSVPGLPIYHQYENAIIIGGNAGRSIDLDTDFNFDYYHFNGDLDTVRIYDWQVNNFDIGALYREKETFMDLIWNMPTGTQNYIEEIERFFKHKLPGMKSQFFNIRIVGLKITDPDNRAMIEDIIKTTVKKISPAYTELYKIIWE